MGEGEIEMKKLFVVGSMLTLLLASCVPVEPSVIYGLWIVYNTIMALLITVLIFMFTIAMLVIVCIRSRTENGGV